MRVAPRHQMFPRDGSQPATISIMDAPASANEHPTSTISGHESQITPLRKAAFIGAAVVGLAAGMFGLSRESDPADYLEPDIMPTADNIVQGEDHSNEYSDPHPAHDEYEGLAYDNPAANARAIEIVDRFVNIRSEAQLGGPDSLLEVSGLSPADFHIPTELVREGPQTVTVKNDVDIGSHGQKVDQVVITFTPANQGETISATLSIVDGNLVSAQTQIDDSISSYLLRHEAELDGFDTALGMFEDQYGADIQS